MTNLTAPTQGTSSELTPGQVLGDRFEVGAKYGSDGFGRLYGGTDTKTRRNVSLRQLRPHLATPEVVRALRNEVKACGAAQHPSAHVVFGLAAAPDGSPVLVQAPVAGRNLADHVQKHRQSGEQVTLRGAYNVVAHVAQALEALSGLGAHGALRPSVVWISSDGKVSLMDFALTRAVFSQLDASRLPDSDAAYLAPEVKSGQRPSAQSDVFGLSALLYVLLTGRSPSEEFIAPSQAHPDADQRLDQQMLKALSADPAARHGSAAEFREALLPLMSGLEEANAGDFGVDVEIDVSLASIAPSMPPAADAPGRPGVSAPRPAPLPQIVGDPQAGMRVSAHEPFRSSQGAAGNEQQAAEQRKSIGSVDLQDVLAKITENDDARWMLVKDGMDHGPFTGKQLVNMIVKGEALAEHGLMNMDTGERRKVKEFTEFTDFLAQYELRQKEEYQKQAVAKAETKERRSTLFKVGVGAAIVAALALAGGGYLLSRSASKRNAMAGEELGDLYERGEIEISGSAGILPPPKRRSGKQRRGGGGGGGGGGMSYEQAMMQAVDIGSASGGGERQLSAGTVAGVMNRHLNGIYNACVKGSVGTVRIDMAILGSGAVQGVSVRAGDAGFQKCVASRVRSIRFPKFPAPRMGARYSFDT